MRRSLEHPEDRSIRVNAEIEAEETIGPFWRKNWRKFVKLIKTYPDNGAHNKLDVLRDKFWGAPKLKKGEPPQGAT
jgi:hypothetical protein